MRIQADGHTLQGKQRLPQEQKIRGKNDAMPLGGRKQIVQRLPDADFRKRNIIVSVMQPVQVVPQAVQVGGFFQQSHPQDGPEHALVAPTHQGDNQGG
ncbi:hypothetical protein D1872_263300 [compost metagenome]